ncbi:MAG: glycosyltransferase family 4 protein [archaeon]
MKVTVCARKYPSPGGRVSLLVSLLENFPSIKIVSYENISGRFRKLRYNIKCWKFLRAENPDIVVGMGLANELSMLYARLFRKKGYYNLSGLRFNGYNFISINVLSELISILLCSRLIVPSDAAKERIQKYLPIFRKKVLVIPEGVRPIKNKAHIGTNIGFTRISYSDFERVYGQIAGNYSKFDSATLFFIKPEKIEIIKYGKLRTYEKSSMKELLPLLDCLFILPSSNHDYHSSSMLEALEANVPFFITEVKFLERDVKPHFFMKNDNIKTIISKYADFRKNRKIYVAKYQKLRKRILSKYSYDKTIKTWKNLLGF